MNRIIEIVKEKISRFIITRKLKSIVLSEQDFSESLKRSGSFLFLMPEDETDFRACFIVLNHFEELNKSIKVITRDYRISLLPTKFRNRAMEIGINNLNKLDLPSQQLTATFAEMRFGAVIDLNRKDNLFYSFVANLVNAKIRIGYAKKGADKFYNFQVADSDIDPAQSYKSFLNCLKMF